MRAVGSDATQNAPIILENDWHHCEHPAAGIQLQALQHRIQEIGCIYFSVGVLEIPGNKYRTLFNYYVKYSWNSKCLATVANIFVFFETRSHVDQTALRLTVYVVLF